MPGGALSALRRIGHVNRVAKVQRTGLLGQMVARSQARALERSLHPALGARERRVDGFREVESPVAIGVWALEFEEGSCRRVQNVSLRGRNGRAAAGEFELEAQLLHCGKRCADHSRSRSIAAHALALLLPGDA